MAARQGVEIERKFLVRELPADLDRHPASEIEQGYVVVDADGLEVRLRRRGDRAWLTIKSGGGRTRMEEEIELRPEQFERLWPLTAKRRITKTRFEIPAAGGRVIELDRYHGSLRGLITAEVEFSSQADSEQFEPPPWFDREVTDDPAYKNQQLASGGPPRSTIR